MTYEKSIVINTESEIEAYKIKIISNLDVCKDMLSDLLKREDSLAFFKKVKFEKTVVDPLTGAPENLIEVINQCQTYFVTLMGAEYLISKFPNTTFKIRLGNVSGYDIESVEGTIVAECFAATSYRGNKKLAEDLKRLSENDSATHKYEFFYDTEFTDKNKIYYENKYPDIKIVHFTDVR